MEGKGEMFDEEEGGTAGAEKRNKVKIKIMMNVQGVKCKTGTASIQTFPKYGRMIGCIAG